MMYTEKDLKNQERLRKEILEERKKKKNNTTKKRIAWWLSLIGYICIGWLIWDVWHMEEYLLVPRRINFGIFKFFVAIITLAIASNILNDEKENEK